MKYTSDLRYEIVPVSGKMTIPAIIGTKSYQHMRQMAQTQSKLIGTKSYQEKLFGTFAYRSVPAIIGTKSYHLLEL